MGVSATWRRHCGRWEVTVRRYGKRKRKLAAPGMGKLQAVAVFGDQLLQEMEAAMATEAQQAEEAALPMRLWRFCAEVYTRHHGVGPVTWSRRKYKVAGIMEDLGHLRLDEVTTEVVTTWTKRLETEGAPLQDGGRGKPLARVYRVDREESLPTRGSGPYRV